MVVEGSCQIIWTVYFAWIGNNSFYFIYFFVGVNLLGVIGGFYLVESPRYLFGMERFD
jgi:predicted ABC-type sugar transport system permease subunit